MSFSSFFIKRPKFSIVIALVMILLGSLAIFVLPISQYPQITPPQIVVSASYPGANAKNLNDLVATPIENAINGVDGMLYMSSVSNDNGTYALTVTFDIGVNSDIAQVKVENRLQQINSILPTVVQEEGLTVVSQNSDMLGFLVFTSPNQTYDYLHLSNYAYTNIKNPLSRVPGIGSVNVYGPEFSIRVWIDPLKIASLNLSVQDIQTAIENQNLQMGLGSIGSMPSEVDTNLVLNLTSKGELTNIPDFENIIVATGANGAIVKLKDIARVEIGANVYNVRAEYNNEPSIIMSLSQLPNTNSLDIMEEIENKINNLSKSFPEDMKLEIAYNSTDFVKISIKNIISTLLLTFGVVILVVFLFLQNFWATLIPVITIPVSLIATFSIIYLLGFDINTFTLFAMILAIGLVVDDAIVVVERVEYLMKYKNLNSSDATEKAMEEITGSIVATTLVLLSIFLPVGLMAGLTGQIYKQFSVTIITAVVFSAVNALTLSPAMCAIFLNKHTKTKSKFFVKFNKGLDFIKSIYIKIITYLLNNLKKASLLIFLGICVIGFLFIKTPTSFVPEEDLGLILVNVELPNSSSLNQTKKLLSEISTDIRKKDGVKYMISIAGKNIMGAGGENIGMGVIGLTNWDKRTSKNLSIDNLEAEFRSMFENNITAMIDFYVLPPIPGIGTANGLSLQLNAFNQSLNSDDLSKKLDELLLTLNISKYFNFAFSTFASGSPHVYIDIDRLKLLSLNISPLNLFTVLQSTLGSSYINNVTLLGQINQVIIQSDFKYRKSLTDIENTYIKSENGNILKLSEVAKLKTVLIPKTIYRFNQYLSAAIIAETKPGISSSEAIKFIEKEGEKLGRDYTLSWTGLSLQEIETKGLIFILIILAFVFGYLFLVALYESWLMAFAVMFSNIFAIMGALLGLMLLSQNLSIYAQLGIVLLIGLASKNAILIVTFIINNKKENGIGKNAAIEGFKERFRAVLMTASTFILGVMPMVFATGAGAASQKSMGISVFFGMFLATIIGIIFIPVLFLIFDKLAEKNTRGKNEKN